MEEVRLRRNGKEDLEFTGVVLAGIDDREWLDTGSTWWELTLYKTLMGQYVLASVFHIVYPSKRILYGARVFTSKDEVVAFLQEEYSGPEVIVDTMMKQAAEADIAFSGNAAQEPQEQQAPLLPAEFCPIQVNAA